MGEANAFAKKGTRATVQYINYINIGIAENVEESICLGYTRKAPLLWYKTRVQSTVHKVARSLRVSLRMST
jgi:hypothetical protein